MVWYVYTVPILRNGTLQQISREEWVMTDKELKKLSRTELLELLLTQSKEVERLKVLLKQANDKVESRALMVEEAGSIAEAALKVNGVFEAAQQAAEQYLENVRALADRENDVYIRREEESKQRAKKIIEDAQRQSDALKKETQKICDEMIRQAQSVVELCRSEAAGKPVTWHKSSK